MAGAQERSYVAGRFALSLDGVSGGFLKSVKGGAAHAPVIKEPAGPTPLTYKNIGPINYDEFEFEVGMSMSPSFYEWIRASWQKDYMRKSGAVHSCNFNFEIMSTREFHEALISKTTIPTLDGSEKKPCYMTVGVHPESIRFRPGDRSKVSGEFSPRKQKKWLPSNFRFELDDLPCLRVNKIDSFTVEQKVITDEIGRPGDYEKEPATLLYPDLTVSLSSIDAKPWHAWFEDFVIRGNCGVEGEKQGRIVFLSPNLKTELGHIELRQVGIFSINSDSESEAGDEEIKRTKVKLYVEEMDIIYGSEVM